MRPKILIRFDDICHTMDYALWEAAMRILDKYNVKPLVGVIPDCTDPDLQFEDSHADFWLYVKMLESKGYTIALHGFNHVFDTQTRGKINNRFISEYAGHTLDEQIEKIRKGKELLLSHGIATDVFYAPAHSYDDNTIKALSLCGFKYMSDSYSKLPYKKHGVICLPTRPALKDGPYWTAVFHAHEWGRKNPQEELKKFENLISSNIENIVTFEQFTFCTPSCTVWQELLEFLFVIRKRYVAKLVARLTRK